MCLLVRLFSQGARREAKVLHDARMHVLHARKALRR